MNSTGSQSVENLSTVCNCKNMNLFYNVKIITRFFVLEKDRAYPSAAFR